MMMLYFEKQSKTKRQFKNLRNEMADAKHKSFSTICTEVACISSSLSGNWSEAMHTPNIVNFMSISAANGTKYKDM